MPLSRSGGVILLAGLLMAPETPASPADPLLEKAGPAYLYPNPLVTTGSVDPAVTQATIDQTICKPHYTETVRDVKPQDRRLVLGEYGVYAPEPGSFELDHFISLELGGSNDPSNLWPEPYCPKTRPADCFGAREKDVVENWLHRQVCGHDLSLRDAQAAIKMDWFALYERIKAAQERR